MDTLRNLYSKTCFCIKHHGLISNPIYNSIGLNLGGNASGFMFRRYMADLSEYMESEHAVCAGDLVIPHLLWADNLILFSEAEAGLQRQSNGFLWFCRNNAMILNHLNTKEMLFGKQHYFSVTYYGEAVEVVQSYRYLGNVVQHMQKQNGDIYSNTHEHLSEKGRKACFSLQHRLRQFDDISPSIMCNMYEAIVSPVLTYGSDVWCHLKVCRDAADSVFFLNIWKVY